MISSVCSHYHLNWKMSPDDVIQMGFWDGSREIFHYREGRGRCITNCKLVKSHCLYIQYAQQCTRVSTFSQVQELQRILSSRIPIVQAVLHCTLKQEASQMQCGASVPGLTSYTDTVQTHTCNLLKSNPTSTPWEVDIGKVWYCKTGWCIMGGVFIMKTCVDVNTLRNLWWSWVG